MPDLRSLFAATLVVALMSGSGPALAQSVDPGLSGTLPLARQPDGLLPLEGTPWRLRSYRWKDVERRPGPEVAARVRLQAGKLEASGGCTAFKGSYGTSGSAIDFKLTRLEQNDCGEQTTMVQLAMVDGLRRTARFETSATGGESQLWLFDHDGAELLRFSLDDVSSFAGTRVRTEWLLTGFSVDGGQHEADATTAANVSFSPRRRNEAKARTSGDVLGSTGCNGFRGEFSLAANVLSVGQLSATDAPCAQSTQLQQEAILEVFDASAITVAFPPDRMVLTSTDGDTALEYRALASVEGTTWFRSPLPDFGASDPVTLRLAAGVASGQGPCGAYSADYVTDGLFITFSDVRGADDGACVAAKEERKLLAALRASVRVDRDAAEGGRSPRLTLRDARGKRLARFISPYDRAP
jgi:heat shock protein HslJ